MNLEIVKSKSVLEMITVAHEFCLFTESIEKQTQENILHYYHKICPLLYLKGSLLPDIVVEDNSHAERFVTEEQWESILQSLQSKLNGKDVFYFKEDCFSGSETALKVSLSEFIADIYQDMKDFVLLFQKNVLAAKENALYECKQLFISHWGLRALEVPKSIHQFTLKIDSQDDLVL